MKDIKRPPRNGRNRARKHLRLDTCPVPKYGACPDRPCRLVLLVAEVIKALPEDILPSESVLYKAIEKLSPNGKVVRAIEEIGARCRTEGDRGV